MNVWDKLSDKYDTLWVQKYSLAPSRKKALDCLKNSSNSFSLLDVGCATGQLLYEIKKLYPNAELLGIDKSSMMIKVAKEKSKDIKFDCVVAENFDTYNKFDFITCCHSFPYYTEKSAVLEKLSKLLQDKGKAIFIQASINSFYDKFVMSIVEKTAEKAEYLSKKDFCDLAEKYFFVENIFTIREQWFMPTIAGFVLGKKI